MSGTWEEEPAEPRERFALDRVRAAMLGAEAPEERVLVGRYVLSQRLGAGAMGVVHEAFDPELKRRVAVKFVRTRATAPDSLARRSRIAREAQTLARLTHPNIVRIYDVGLTERSLYLVMELVEGADLRRWLSRPRPRERVLDLLAAAGRGLSAAHQAGIIHRDFKPDNVLVGNDGRARVVDFGLARPETVGATPSPFGDSSGDGLFDGPGDARLEGVQTPEPSKDVRTAGSSARWDLVLTGTGSTLGTPGYMAPEQHRGRCEPRSDQFALCVTAFEALAGVRPYQGDSVADLEEAKRRGPPPCPEGVEPRVWQVFARGMAPEPSERWPTIEAMLDALEAARRPVRRRRAAVAGLGLLAAGAAAMAMASTDDPCPEASEEIEGTWDEARRVEIRQALRATEVPYADATWSRIEPRLDAQAAAWSRARRQACMLERSDEAWDERTLDASLLCLSARRDELAALVVALSAVDAEHAAATIDAVSELSSLEPCLDLDALQEGPDVAVPDERTAARVAALRRTLAESAALHRTGHTGPGLRRAVVALEQAQALDHAPVLAEARLQVGALLAGAGRYREAAAHFEQAHHEAWAIRHDQVATKAAVFAAWEYAAHLGDAEQAQSWAAKAGPLLEHRHAPASLRARYHRALSAAHQSAGAYEAAYDESSAALQVLERSLEVDDARRWGAVADVGHDLERLGRHAEALTLLTAAHEGYLATVGELHPVIASIEGSLGVTKQNAGDLDGAAEHLERALALAERVSGPNHPDTAQALVNLAVLRKNTGDYAQAEPLYRRALQLYVRLHGEDHMDVALVRTNLANVLTRQGRLDEARVQHRKALEGWERVHGAEHPKTALARANYAQFLSRAGEPELAVEQYETSIAHFGARAGQEHPLMADLYDSLGGALTSAERADEAIAHHERALDIREATTGLEHPKVAESRQGLGEALIERDAARAVELLSLALQSRERAGGPADATGRNRFALARAQWSAGEPTRAIETAEHARRELESVDPVDLAKVERWLEAHRN